jgi:hypothetical protein
MAYEYYEPEGGTGYYFDADTGNIYVPSEESGGKSTFYNLYEKNETPLSSGEAIDKSIGEAYKEVGVSPPGFFEGLLGKFGLSSSTAKSLADKLTSPGGIATGLGVLYSLTGGGQPRTSGYKGKIPQLTATRTPIAQPEYKPYTGEAVMGRQYFSPTTYAPKTATTETVPAAQGGLMQGRYLRGKTDGMADEIDTTIEDRQPAKLSHGEFVIPADVVSHLGNGNSDAGADVLYKMMDKVRKARTGSSKQGKKINPEKFTPGGIAGYAQGGVAKFQTGGTTSANPFAASPYGSSSAQSLSEFAGPYVGTMLGQAQALAETPYTAYTGPLTAGYSPLQTAAFTEAGKLEEPTEFAAATQGAKDVLSAATGATYTPTTFSSGFTAPSAYTPVGGSITQPGMIESYMNPYLANVLTPQIQALQRQADIQRAALGPQAARGGFGARSDLMRRQIDADLMRQQQQATGQAFGQAYQTGLGQFNVEAQRRAQEAQFGAQQALEAARTGAQLGLTAQEASERSRQFGAQQGLANLSQRLAASQALGQFGTTRADVARQNLMSRLAAGAQQRAIEQEGIGARKAQFEEERKYPYANLQFLQSMLQGIPIGTTSYTPNLTGAQTLVTQGKDIAALYDLINKAFKSDTTTPTP